MPGATEIIAQLQQYSNPSSLEGMKRFGMNVDSALGIPIPVLRKLAKELKRDHQLALELWDTGIHEARILASMIDDPKKVTGVQINTWAKEFNSWDVCDQVCGNLFDRTPFAVNKAKEFSQRKEEFVKRAGFTLMATYAVHNKKEKDEVFLSFFPFIEKGAEDERNFVKKAVNWALRQIGKRNENLQQEAIKLAERIAKQESKSAKWIARDALTDLKKKTFKSSR